MSDQVAATPGKYVPAPVPEVRTCPIGDGLGGIIDPALFTPESRKHTEETGCVGTRKTGGPTDCEQAEYDAAHKAPPVPGVALSRQDVLAARAEACFANFDFDGSAGADCELPAGHEGEHQATLAWHQAPTPPSRPGDPVLTGYLSMMASKFAGARR